MGKSFVNISFSIFIFLVFSICCAEEPIKDQAGQFYWDKSKAWNGYTLIAPLSSTSTYLVDMELNIVNTWESDCSPGMAAYLLENGNLIRTGMIKGRNSTFRGGGIGGRVQEFEWDGTLIWDFEYSNTEHILHHDIEYLPNGNTLMIVWERKTAQDSSSAGSTADIELWPDCIIEVSPSSARSGEIVWEWHSWDHMIQDVDPSKPNYGNIEKHPELININSANGSMKYAAEGLDRHNGKRSGKIGSMRNGGSDMHHINGIDYNPELDQILLSVRWLNEIWIIDHSTTIKEAQGHVGGRYGSGGDLLFRWGNPQASNSGTTGDRKLFHQHDATWIPDNYPGTGDILVFNNGGQRGYSSVDAIAFTRNIKGLYNLGRTSVSDLASIVWSYTSSSESDFYSGNLSGAQRLPNGNTLICSGKGGVLFEVNQGKEVVWRYGSLSGKGNRSSGMTTRSQVFKVERFAPDNPALRGKELTPKGLVFEITESKQVRRAGKWGQGRSKVGKGARFGGAGN